MKMEQEYCRKIIVETGVDSYLEGTLFKFSATGANVMIRAELF